MTLYDPRWSDRRLAHEVAHVVATPKADPADSFVLHAPLELLARTGLLGYVPAPAREPARRRLHELSIAYADAGPSVAAPAPVDVRPLPELAARLGAAIAAGDLDDVDRLASSLGLRASPAELRALLAGAVVDSLAAAGHASILFYLFPRVAPEGSVSGTILRGPARELARHPEMRLEWFEDPDDRAVTGTLTGALLDVPVLGVPGSDFIFPVMHQAEQSGVAANLLSGFVRAPIDPARARRELGRIAAWSMLQEPPDYAPYGWSHCLTMPQAVMGLAGDGVDATRAVAIAATYVVGFRAAFGTRPLDPTWVPEPPTTRRFVDARSCGPDVAAAHAWHTPDAEFFDLVGELAAFAAAHRDAHLVKYTFACIDAAGADPAYRRLYLAAAASLAGWWAVHPAHEDAA
jgi:hypothetical protein